MHNLSLADARKFILNRQLLSGFNGSAIDAVNHMGYIQIDTIFVVERAHHHVLWSRCHEFTPKILDELHRVKGAVFEYWAHAMSYLPMADYRFSLPVMKRFGEREDCREILAANKNLTAEIRQRISSEGPLSASDFASPEEFKGGGWWNRKPAKQVLEVLYWQGELMISHRKNFKRYYDLSSRVIANADQAPDLTVPDNEERHRHHLLRVLRTLGVASRADLFWFVKDRATTEKVLQEMVIAKEVCELKIEKQPNSYFALQGLLNQRLPQQDSKTVCILSPFDNMTIRRDFIKRLFEFDYLFECYVPEAKRKFGYFSCPILAGSDLIGTIDAKADRTRKNFLVKSLHLSESFTKGPQKNSLFEAIARHITDFARFNGCNSITITCQNKPSRKIATILKKS